MRKLALLVALTGCLDPLVEDGAGASANLLPPGADVPSAADNPELAAQIALNDGIDDRALLAAGRITRGTGFSGGQAVRFWSFGPATRAPSPLYQLYDDAGPITAHPPFVDAVPGDPGYSAMHTLTKVHVTAKYAGELITSVAALADAVDLGLVDDPLPLGLFVASPIVLPGTPLEVGPGDATVLPETVYARGHRVGMFRFGGDRGVQPGAFILPTLQVSFLRDHDGAGYDASRPVFQATIPAAPPAGMTINYTALSTVVDVDLADNTAAAVKADGDLFKRSAMGAITGTMGIASFQVTPTVLLLPIQFEEGQP
jgi:hypothetical protein